MATKKRIWLRVLIIVFAALFAIVAILGITFAAVWNNEISTVSSMEKIRDRNDSHLDGAVYRMNVQGGFYFDDYLENGGAKSDKELISFITDHITRGLIDMTIKESDIGCSSFTAQAQNGDRLFGRNYDFAKTNTCITLCDPGDGRYKSFSTVDLQFVGMDVDKDVEGLMNKITCLAAPFAPLDGMNEKGVSCAIYMTYQGEETVATDQNDPQKPNITSTTMLRMILDYAANVDEAVALVQKYNLHDSANTSYHYMIADASGKSAILEWVPVNGTDLTDNDGTKRELVVTYNTGDQNIGEREGKSDFQWITNFILQPDYYENNDQKPGYDRYEEIYNRLNATNGIVENESAAMDILKAVGRRSWKNDDNNGCTVHSVVYNLTQKTVLWVSNENYGDKSATFTYSFETGKLEKAA